MHPFTQFGCIVSIYGTQAILRVQIDTINILWLSFSDLSNRYKICDYSFFPAHPHGIGYRFLTCNSRLNDCLLSY